MRFLNRVLSLVFCLSQLTLAASQQKSPTIRDDIRKHGKAHYVSYPEDPFLETFEQLVSRSDVIIRGRVVDERTRLSSTETNVFTDYTIEVLEILKDRQSLVLVGQKLTVSKLGGNLVLEGKPVRVDTPNLPPVPWITPHYFFLGRLDEATADAEFGFVGGSVGAFEIERGKMVCKDKDEKKQHPITRDFCNKATEQEFLQVLREKIASQPK